MKKLALTFVIVLGLGISAFAEGGLFQRSYNAQIGKSGYVYYGNQYNFFAKEDNPVPLIPIHGLDDDQDAGAPVGSGIAMLAGLGAAYLIGKRRKE